LSPEELVDANATRLLADAIVELIASGSFDDLPDLGVFHNLSLSRLGFAGQQRVAGGVLAELESRGLATPTTDGVSVPVHPVVR
jgi:hypothetical protein